MKAINNDQFGDFFHQNSPNEIDRLFNDTSIQPHVVQLIRLRATQFSDCSSCLGLQMNRAINAGVSREKILNLSTWWESDLFSLKEKSILAATDDLMHIKSYGVKSENLDIMKDFFSESEIHKILILIDTIKVWNHMSVSTHLHN